MSSLFFLYLSFRYCLIQNSLLLNGKFREDSKCKMFSDFSMKIQSQLSFKLYLCAFLRQERNSKWLVIAVLQRVYSLSRWVHSSFTTRRFTVDDLLAKWFVRMYIWCNNSIRRRIYIHLALSKIHPIIHLYEIYIYVFLVWLTNKRTKWIIYWTLIENENLQRIF